MSLTFVLGQNFKFGQNTNLPRERGCSRLERPSKTKTGIRDCNNKNKTEHLTTKEKTKQNECYLNEEREFNQLEYSSHHNHILKCSRIFSQQYMDVDLGHKFSSFLGILGHNPKDLIKSTRARSCDFISWMIQGSPFYQFLYLLFK